MDCRYDRPDDRWGFSPWATHLLHKIREQPGELPDYAPPDYVLVLQGRGLIECMHREARGRWWSSRMHFWFQITPAGLEFLRGRDAVREENMAMDSILHEAAMQSEKLLK